MFIVFEGCEGSGKSSHSKALAQRLQEAGYNIVHTREPGGSELGLEIRHILLQERTIAMADRTELFLFLAARAQHVQQVINPALAAGSIVICDRFSGSTLAYQIGARQLPQSDLVLAAEEYARYGLQPDLVLYLDIDPQVGLQRKAIGHEEMTRIDGESLTFHQAVRAYFQKLVDTHADHWLAFENIDPVPVVNDRLFQAVTQRLAH